VEPIVIQDELLVALHWQPAGAVRPIEPDPPLADKPAVVEFRDTQGAVELKYERNELAEPTAFTAVMYQ
jgi:hypothetical protein